MTQQDDITQQLKPCPFCGGPVELENTINSRSWWGVVCRNTINRGGTCAIQTRPSASKEVAIERWNMRAPVADTLPLEAALHVLVDKIVPGLDTGDLVQDARRASTALSAVLASAPVAGEAQPVAVPDEVYAALQYVEGSLAAITNRQEVVGDVVERIDSIAIAAKRAKAALSRLQSVAQYFDAAPQASEAVRDVEDAERWRWATASDGNADKLCSIVLCHGGYQDRINERADFYRAALSAQPAAQPGAQKEQSDGNQ